MSVTLSFTLKVDTVLTNATSVEFSNEGATIGVRRTDTLASVVAAGTALTNDSTGRYSHTFAEPAEGLTYNWFVKWVYDGDTYYNEFNTTDATVAVTTTSAVPVAEPEVKLFCDAIDHLVDVMGGAAQDRNARNLKSAVRMALDEIANVRDWQYFNRWGRVRLNAPYSTGTITYDHTGGASERLVTLASGTWPTWAARGKLLIAGIAYDIENYLSSTTLTLSADHNPGADVAALTTYVIYQNEYPLLPTFRAMRMLIGENTCGYEYVSPSELLRLERLSPGADSPRRFTIVGSRELPGGFVLQVESYPSASETVDFPVQVFPRRLKRTGYESGSYSGTVTISANSRAVVGSGTAFNVNMVGAVLRLSTSTTTVPTDDSGDNPYDEQLTIESVTDTTHLTLVNAAGLAYTAAKYRIADPIHLDRTLFNVYLHACAHHLAALTGDKKSSDYYALYKAALTQALEWDTKVAESGPGRGDHDWVVDFS